jgi:hypothetical protein
MAKKGGAVAGMNNMDVVKLGFFAGLGSFASFIIFILIAMAFFIPGFILLKREEAKPKEEQKQSNKVFAYILMGLGMLFGLGFGAGTFFSELGGEF